MDVAIKLYECSFIACNHFSFVRYIILFSHFHEYFRQSTRPHEPRITVEKNTCTAQFNFPPTYIIMCTKLINFDSFVVFCFVYFIEKMKEYNGDTVLFILMLINAALLVVLYLIRACHESK